MFRFFAPLLVLFTSLASLSHASVFSFSYQGQDQVCLENTCFAGRSTTDGEGLTGRFDFDMDVLLGGALENTTVSFALRYDHDAARAFDRFWTFSVDSPTFSWSAATPSGDENLTPSFDAAAADLGFGVEVFGDFREYLTTIAETQFAISFDQFGEVSSWLGNCTCGGSADPSTFGDLVAGTGADGRFGLGLGSTGPGVWTRTPVATVPLTATGPFLLATLGGLGALGRRKNKMSRR